MEETQVHFGNDLIKFMRLIKVSYLPENNKIV